MIPFDYVPALRPLTKLNLVHANLVCLSDSSSCRSILSGLDSASLNMENRWVCLYVCLCVS